MDDFEHELRRTLADRADSLPDAFDAPPEVVAHVRRRRAVKRGALALSIVLVVSGSVSAIAGVVGRDDAKQVVAIQPFASTPSTTSAIKSPPQGPGPAVVTHACPILSMRPGTPDEPPPSTVPRVAAGGDPAQLRHLVSFAATDRIALVVLGPRTWSCQATFFADDSNGMVVYPAAATPGRVPSPADAPIAVEDGHVACRPTAGLTQADCDTIVADYFARIGALAPADPGAPKVIAAAPYAAGSWTPAISGIAIAKERGGGVAVYDAATDRWRTFAGPPFSDPYDVVAARGNSVFVRANPNSSSASTTAFAELDVSTGAWRSLAPVPADVPFFETTGDADHIFGVGAFENNGDEPIPGTIAVEYDLRTDRWTKLPASPLSGRGGFTAEWTGTELLIWSGGSNHQGCVPAYPDGAAYNPSTRTWRSLPVAPVAPRSWAAHAWTGTELLVWSGDPGSCGRPPITNGAAYNPAKNQWRRLPSAPLSGARAPIAAWTGEEMFVFRGGDAAGDLAAAAYNPSSDSWRTLAAPPRASRREGGPATAAVVDGQVLLALVGDGSFGGLLYPAG